MAIDDPLEKVLQQYAEESSASISEVALESAINAIPIAGGPIAALFSGLARRRIRERLIEVLEQIKEEIVEVHEDSISKEFFYSEEFQTLFSLALDQLQTTHDRKKLKLLAVGLAHSGFRSFSEENRKELFIRALRDLTAVHIDFLTELLPNYTAIPPDWSEDFIFRQRIPKSGYRGVSLMLIQHLLALGFVEEVFKERSTPNVSALSHADIGKINNWINELIRKPRERFFQISELGRDFLKFLGITRRAK